MMEGVSLLPLLLFISLSTVYSSSEVFKLSGGSSRTIKLPTKEAIVVAVKSVLGELKFSYEITNHEKELDRGDCVGCFQASSWLPVLMITKEGIMSKHFNHLSTARHVTSSDAREITLKARAAMEFQVIDLPLECYDENKTSFTDDGFLDLPDAEEVWLTLKSMDGSTITSSMFQLFKGNESTRDIYPFTATSDWSIIRIYERTIHFGNTKGNLDNHMLSGRRIRLFNESFLLHQVFAVPLKPKDRCHEDGVEKDQDNSSEHIITVVAVGVVISLLVILSASYFCYRCFSKKKKNDTRTEDEANFTEKGTSAGEYFRTVAHPGITRQNSSHDSENSLYVAATTYHAGLTRQNTCHDSENSLYVAATTAHPGVVRWN